jgi:hypothetical protein
MGQRAGSNSSIGFPVRILDFGLAAAGSRFHFVARVNAHLPRRGDAAWKISHLAIKICGIGGNRQARQQLRTLSRNRCRRADEWKQVVKAFQKRHLIAHKMGMSMTGTWSRAHQRRSSGRFSCGTTP